MKRCWFFHRWGEWSEPTKHHVYVKLLGGTNVEIVSEVAAGPCDLDLGVYTLQSRYCARCGAQEQRRAFE